MICRSCGTQIADRAIVCYRCGTGTTDPVRQPAPTESKWGPPVRSRRRGPRMPELTSLVLLIVLALYLGFGGVGEIPPTVAYTIAATAAALLVWRIARRWRG
jgi:hypothetical protein